MIRPEPPFLVVRSGRSFWVETGALEECSATLQAFRDGCFHDAWCYDSTGGRWTILEATLKERPSFSHHELPWKRVAVQLRLGPRMEADVGAVVAQLALALRPDSEFCESLQTPPAEVLSRFQHAQTAADIIDIARKYQ